MNSARPSRSWRSWPNRRPIMARTVRRSGMKEFHCPKSRTICLVSSRGGDAGDRHHAPRQAGRRTDRLRIGRGLVRIGLEHDPVFAPDRTGARDHLRGDAGSGSKTRNRIAVSRKRPMLPSPQGALRFGAEMSKPLIFTISAAWDDDSVWTGHCDDIPVAADAPTNCWPRYRRWCSTSSRTIPRTFDSALGSKLTLAF